MILDGSQEPEAAGLPHCLLSAVLEFCVLSGGERPRQFGRPGAKDRGREVRHLRAAVGGGGSLGLPPEGTGGAPGKLTRPGSPRRAVKS